MSIKTLAIRTENSRMSDRCPIRVSLEAIPYLCVEGPRIRWRGKVGTYGDGEIGFGGRNGSMETRFLKFEGVTLIVHMVRGWLGQQMYNFLLRRCRAPMGLP